jgi:hypothetical protein
MRLRVEVLILAFALAPSACLLTDDCGNEVRGIRNGQRVRSSIVGIYRPDDVAGSWPTCAALGDLEPGSSATFTAKLRGPGDGCEDGVALEPDSSGDEALQLPAGCSGRWTIALHEHIGTAKFTDPPNADDSSWTLERLFTATSDPKLCFGEDADVAYCRDEFIAENTLL